MSRLAVIIVVSVLFEQTSYVCIYYDYEQFPNKSNSLCYMLHKTYDKTQNGEMC